MLPQTFCATHGCYYVHPQVQGTLDKGFTDGFLSKPRVQGSLGKNLTNGYFDGPKVQTTLESQTDTYHNLTPLILFTSENGNINRSKLTEKITEFSNIDDVFSADFMSDTIVVQTPNPVLAAEDDLENIETKMGSWTIKSILRLDGGNHKLLEGPYFLSGQNIYQAWKLYPDELDCFSVSVIPQNTQAANEGFYPLASMDLEGIWKNVAVPSRLYSFLTKEKPLSGMRISIKDNFRLAGVKSTLSSRPFEATYGPDTTSASFVKKLIQLGAIIVAKSKMSAFASSEEPTDQWVDFHAPFNPRGDGYQTPAGSSNGGAAALAGYAWLDYSIGTDTSGSIRYPAAICGVYGLRYTSHTIPTEGIHPCCRELDAIGVMGRDLKAVHEFASLTVESGPGDIRKFPKKIIYPTDFLPYVEKPVQDILEEFVLQLEKYLGVKRIMFNMSERWDKAPPKGAEGKSIKDYLGKTGFYPFYYDGYHEYDQFREDYRNKFNKEPYVGPYMRWKWATGSKVTLEQKDQSLKEMEIYREWFAKNVLQNDSITASDAVLIMPLSCYAPDYRDTIHKEPSAMSSFSETYTASILRLPQLVLPVGQVKYDSRVSGRTEYHPITASLVGAQGSELMLISLAQEVLRSAGWSDTVLTGANTWPVGEGVRNVMEGMTVKL